MRDRRSFDRFRDAHRLGNIYAQCAGRRRSHKFRRLDDELHRAKSQTLAMCDLLLLNRFILDKSSVGGTEIANGNCSIIHYDLAVPA